MMSTSEEQAGMSDDFILSSRHYKDLLQQLKDCEAYGKDADRRAANLETKLASYEALLNAARQTFGHNHWDETLQHGAGCPTCIAQRNVSHSISEALKPAETCKQCGKPHSDCRCSSFRFWSKYRQALFEHLANEHKVIALDFWKGHTPMSDDKMITDLLELQNDIIGWLRHGDDPKTQAYNRGIRALLARLRILMDELEAIEESTKPTV